MNTRVTALLLIILACTSCDFQRGSQAEQDVDSYAVYNALLRAPVPERDMLPNAPTAIVTETEIEKLCFDPHAQSDTKMREASANYLSRNRRPRQLKSEAFDIQRRVEFMTRAEMNKSTAAGWQNFTKTHPDIRGILTLSAVGFSADRSLAIVYVEHWCGGKCSLGAFHTLVKQQGTWSKQPGLLCSWIS